MKKFILTTLIAAGFSVNADAQTSNEFPIEKNQDVSLTNNSLGLETIINQNLPFTLAAHSSHRSHGSHASHSSSSHASSAHSSHASHSSHYSHYSYGSGLNYDNEYKDQGLGRNLNSTPNDSILPRSPAIVEENKDMQKNKILGGSKDFIVLTQRAQLALYGRGYYSGLIDGLMNSEIIASITKFQKKYNLKVSGTLSDDLIAHLNIGGAIEKN